MQCLSGQMSKSTTESEAAPQLFKSYLTFKCTFVVCTRQIYHVLLRSVVRTQEDPLNVIRCRSSPVGLDQIIMLCETVDIWHIERQREYWNEGSI